MDHDKSDDNYRISWTFILLGVGFVLIGIDYLQKGMEALKAGGMVPPMGKSWWMSGPQAVLCGVVTVLAGVGFLVGEGIKAFKRG